MVRTRFAPSPTGFLHIGGVRTALFNYLFARKHGGQFILRIDDTDADRNVTEALAPILAGFRWLGITWDEGGDIGGPHGPYYQSQRLDRYQAAVKQLMDRGLAYRDYSTTEERNAENEAADREKRPRLYSRKWMAQTESDRQRFEAEGRTGVVRLLMPRDGTCEFFDHIRGSMRVPWTSQQDHVIQRADGSCLYNLASVVDDHDMKITHVIRAEEHLSNTTQQVFMADALGYPRPEYAHLPVVAEPGSQNKLSKRKLAQYLKNPDFKKAHEHALAIARAIGLATRDETFNPVIVDFYQQVGYLPDAILNYLLLLGWSLDDKTEDFSPELMIQAFTLERVNKSPASFDVKKLGAFQKRYMTRLPVEPKVEMVLPYLVRAGLVPSPVTEADRETVRQLVVAAGERIEIAGDILDYADFFVADEQLPVDEKAFEKRIRKPPAARTLLAAYRTDVQGLQKWDVPSLETHLARFVGAQGIELGDIIHAVRVAITGKGVGFGLYETLAILGRERVGRRIDLAVARP